MKSNTRSTKNKPSSHSRLGRSFCERIGKLEPGEVFYLIKQRYPALDTLQLVYECSFEQTKEPLSHELNSPANESVG